MKKDHDSREEVLFLFNTDKENMSDKDTEDESQEDSNKDQDSDVSFQEDADEEFDATEIEEDWVEFIKRASKKLRNT